MTAPRRLLVAHADGAHLRALRELLRQEGHHVVTAQSRSAALGQLQRHDVRLALIDVHLPERGGLDLLLELRDRSPTLSIVMLSPRDDQRLAAQALRLGAQDYLLIPPDAHEVGGRVGRLLDRGEAPLPAVATGGAGAGLTPRPLICESPAMRAAVTTLLRLAPTRSTVLLLGESGVGKELFARAIHFNSPRREAPWLALNCSAIPETLIEAELFGHERGAFTGAVGRRVGRFELAHRGTLFLDEVAEMNLASQAKLLRVIEDGEITRVGGTRPRRVDVRLIAATNVDLGDRLRRGLFREDLYFRINVVSLEIPPLRRRAEDLPALLDCFVRESSRANDRPAPRFSPEALDLLLHHAWPGNVRELKNLVESLVVTSTRDVVQPEDLPERLRGEAGSDPGPALLRPGLSIREAEKELIRRTLEHVGGRRRHAARLLRIGVRTLQRKVSRYGLRPTR